MLYSRCYVLIIMMRLRWLYNDISLDMKVLIYSNHLNWDNISDFLRTRECCTIVTVRRYSLF
jgi:hypothetical protein